MTDLVGVRRKAITRFENGKYNLSLKLAMDIGKIFKMQVEDLFEFID
ncbi:helix-turn-helix transcriptional regulator [Clostridium botulinum]